MAESVFAVLSAIDITPFIKKKGNITYLPWSSAWTYVKNFYPDATYSIVKTADGCIYHTDGKTCWVEVSVTIEGQTQNETLAVMDHKNMAIPADTVTSVAVGKSIKRALVKCCALFGLGLSLWNGEELSDNAKEAKAKKQAADEAAAVEQAKLDAALSVENGKITKLAKEKIDGGIPNDTLYAIVMKYTGGKKNPNAIKTLEESAACLAEISALTN